MWKRARLPLRPRRLAPIHSGKSVVSGPEIEVVSALKTGKNAIASLSRTPKWKRVVVVTKLLVYLILDVGLALLAATGFLVGPLLLWPRWMLSPAATVSLLAGGGAAVLLVITCVAYAAQGLNPDLLGRGRPAPYLRILVPLFAIVVFVFYLLPALTLPPPDPTSRPLLLFGPTEQVQILLWTTFTVLIYLPITLTLLVWHVFTIYSMRRRVLHP